MISVLTHIITHLCSGAPPAEFGIPHPLHNSLPELETATHTCRTELAATSLPGARLECLTSLLAAVTHATNSQEAELACNIMAYLVARTEWTELQVSTAKKYETSECSCHLILLQVEVVVLSGLVSRPGLDTSAGYSLALLSCALERLLCGACPPHLVCVLVPDQTGGLARYCNCTG